MFCNLKTFFITQLLLMKTTYNHPCQMTEEGIINGIYCLESINDPDILLFGSGAILNESVDAKNKLNEFGIKAEVYSVTSFNLLRKDGMENDRQKQHDPSYSKKTFLRKTLGNRNQPIVASTDYMRSYPEQIRAFLENDFYTPWK